MLSHCPKTTSSSFHTLERRSIIALLDIKRAKKIVLVVLTKGESSEKIKCSLKSNFLHLKHLLHPTTYL
jgi:hypothetical protein